MRNELFLDSWSNDFYNRLTISGEKYEDLMRRFQRWVKENDIKQEDLWYADIFETKTGKHLAKLSIVGPDIYLHAAPDDSKIRPFRRRMGIIRRIRYIFFRVEFFILNILFEIKNIDN